MTREEILKLALEIREIYKKLSANGGVTHISAFNDDDEACVMLDVKQIPDGCELCVINGSDDQGKYRYIFAIEEGVHFNKTVREEDADYEKYAKYCD